MQYYRVYILSSLLSLILFLSFHGAKAQMPVFSSGEHGLENICRYVLKADYKDRKKLTSSLMPDFEDCKSAFSEEKAKDIYRFIKRINQRHILVMMPEYPQQSQVNIHKAQQADFEAYEGVAQFFPGGYKEMAKYLKPGITYYQIRFVEPGHTNGTNFDLLAYVNDHWCLFLSPWVPCME